MNTTLFSTDTFGVKSAKYHGIIDWNNFRNLFTETR